MNTIKDFHKKASGVVVNTNTKDYKRARNRNFVRREVEKTIGEEGKISSLDKELSNIKDKIKKEGKSIDTEINNIKALVNDVNINTVLSFENEIKELKYTILQNEDMMSNLENDIKKLKGLVDKLLAKESK